MVAVGAVVGTLLDIDGGINCLAENTESKFKKNGSDVSIAEGVISATLLFCVSSMTVTGSIRARLTGDNSIKTKSHDPCLNQTLVVAHF